MPLDEYRTKRDFTKSPEPSGDERPVSHGPGRFFCVQKHLASHLHYDLRLEHAGVLLSWAVPKGPSIDPRDKRLAMRVEDHPLAYGDFEGVIPEGYGAGIVMLWDVGTWAPESPDIDAALRRGELKFKLGGYKLKGSWVLVRTGGRGASAYGDDRSWLLIKHRDEWAGPIDIASFAPRSVKSEGDFEDILAADNPGIWTANRPAPARGGSTGKLLAEIIARAARIKAGQDASRGRTRRSRTPAQGKGSAPAPTRRPGARTAPTPRASQSRPSRKRTRKKGA